MAWARNGTPDTLGSAGANVQITDLTAKKFNQFLSHTLFSTNAARDLTFNADSSSVYARRYSYNGGADGTTTSASLVDLRGNANTEEFHVIYTCSISGEEKLSISFMSEGNAGGAGTAPVRGEIVFKYVPSPDADITQVKLNKGAFTNFDTGSNLTALTGDETEVAVLPKNLQSGSRFEATDTRKIYYGVLPSVTYEDDFSSDNWTDNDSAKIGVSSGSLSFDMVRDGSNDASVYDLGAGNVSDSAWILRGKVTFTSLGSSGNGNRWWFGISDSAQTAGSTTSQDFIGIHFNHDGTSYYFSNDSDGASLPLSTGDNSVTITWATSTPYYVEIKRLTTTTYSVELFSDSSYTTSLGSASGTVASSTQSLRYIKVVNQLDGSGGRTIQGNIDDIKFYNGVSSTDFTWTEEA